VIFCLFFEVCKAPRLELRTDCTNFSQVGFGHFHKVGCTGALTKLVVWLRFVQDSNSLITAHLDLIIFIRKLY